MGRVFSTFCSRTHTYCDFSQVAMKLLGAWIGVTTVSGFPTLGIFGKNKDKEARRSPDEVYNLDFNRAFAQMDQALNRAFAIPIPVFEADVFHMPDGNQFMTPLRQRSVFDDVFGFPISPLRMSPRSSTFSKNDRFLKIGDTSDEEEKSHDNENHATTTEHKITENMLDRLTGKSGLKTTKTTDIVSDDGHSQVHMVVSSFDMDGENDEEEDVGHKTYSVEAEKLFNGEIQPKKTYGFSEEDLKEREFERQKYVHNMINKWHSLLSGPFPQNEDLESLEDIMQQKKDLEEKLAQLNSAEKNVRKKLEEAADKADSGNVIDAIDVVPDEDHVTFKSEKDLALEKTENTDLEDEKEDVEAEAANVVLDYEDKALEAVMANENDDEDENAIEAELWNEDDTNNKDQSEESVDTKEVTIEESDNGAVDNVEEKAEPIKTEAKPKFEGSLKALKNKVTKKKRGRKHRNH